MFGKSEKCEISEMSGPALCSPAKTAQSVNALKKDFPDIRNIAGFSDISYIAKL